MLQIKLLLIIKFIIIHGKYTTILLYHCIVSTYIYVKIYNHHVIFIPIT